MDYKPAFHDISYLNGTFNEEKWEKGNKSLCFFDPLSQKSLGVADSRDLVDYGEFPYFLGRESSISCISFCRFYLFR